MLQSGVIYLICLAVGIISILLMLYLITRLSVYCEDCCDMPFCSEQKRRKQMNRLARDILFPLGFVPSLAPPSDENITEAIICQPYIYRDALATGLTPCSGKTLMTTMVVEGDKNENPFDAVVIQPQ